MGHKNIQHTVRYTELSPDGSRTSGADHVTAPPDQLALRPTVIAGERLEDDFVVVWDGIRIGRIFKNHGAPSGGPAWSWSVIVRDQPQPPAWRGADLAQCKARFKTAWLECIARLNEDDIAAARRAEQDK